MKAGTVGHVGNRLPLDEDELHREHVAPAGDIVGTELLEELQAGDHRIATLLHPRHHERAVGIGERPDESMHAVDRSAADGWVVKRTEKPPASLQVREYGAQDRALIHRIGDLHEGLERQDREKKGARCRTSTPERDPSSARPPPERKRGRSRP
jgi:hypothetical protein